MALVLLILENVMSSEIVFILIPGFDALEIDG